MTNEEVTDEALVEQLEKMRNGGTSSSQQFHSSSVWMQNPSKCGGSVCPRLRSSPNVNEMSLHADVLDRAQTEHICSDNMEDAPTWRTARQALLCCREMVRTEKRYQDELKALLNGEVIIFDHFL